MNTNESIKITARFSGKCTRCHGLVPKGSRCIWVKGYGVRHVSCTPNSVSETPAPAKNGWTEHKEVTVTMGVFKKDGRIYVVKPNRDKTRVYAKEIVESPARMTENGAVVDFEARYAPGVVFKLTEDDRWDLADAKDFLTKFSKCIVCGRSLKAAKSVAQAIGPVCAKYFAHRHGTNGHTHVASVEAEVDPEKNDGETFDDEVQQAPDYSLGKGWSRAAKFPTNEPMDLTEALARLQRRSS